MQLVMVVLKGSVPISFTGTKEPAAFAQLISMGGINKVVKKNLITSLGAILHTHLSIPPARFFCHVVDTTAGRQPSKL
ncbi:Macrophage migration inhibitory factor-like protein [Bienertia sinuspersici]